MIKQDEAIGRIIKKLGTDRNTIFDKGWLDIESLFRREGWKVNLYKKDGPATAYDKPGYNETYQANFTFSRK